MASTWKINLSHRFAFYIDENIDLRECKHYYTPKNMKVAFCLYGQPRLAQRGHDNIASFLRHQDVSVDFYMHLWHDPEKMHFDSSPWRALSEAELRIDTDTIPFLLDAYRPVACQIERPRKLHVTGIQESIMFQNSDHITRANMNNSLSQIYSKQCVRDLLAPRAHEYDWIIMSRYDFLNPIGVDMMELEKNKIHVPDFRLPQALFSDAFVICSPSIFLPLFNAYADMVSIMDDQALHHKMGVYGERAVLVTENILFASFVKHFSVENHVAYTPQIPDFH